MVTTSDGGVTWTVRDSGTEAELRAVWMVDTDLVVAVGQEGTHTGTFATAIRSEDGGATWESATVAVAESFLNGVAMFDSSRGIAAGGLGSDETLLVTEDGGRTWQDRSRKDGSTGFNDVWAHGTQHAWLGGGRGYVLYTTDGGQTWLEADAETTRPMWALHFVSTTHGWAVTNNTPDVHYTEDGGASWTKATAAGFGNFSDVHFGSPDVGIAVGPTGGVYGTEDAGRTWAEHAPGWSGFGHVRSVWMTSETDGVIVGTEGKIQYTRSAGGMSEK